MKRLEEFMVVSFDGIEKEALDLFTSIKFSRIENSTFRSLLKNA